MLKLVHYLNNTRYRYIFKIIVTTITIKFYNILITEKYLSYMYKESLHKLQDIYKGKKVCAKLNTKKYVQLYKNSKISTCHCHLA